MRALTGIKPTGTPHLGNLLGAIEPALALTAEYETFYFIADYHALTVLRSGEQLRDLTYEITAAWLALGLDPATSLIYLQSDVPEVFELAWILSCVTPKGLLNRAHAYKAAVAENERLERDPDQGVNAGLFTYPVLMAADILLFRADAVPVGQDQRQHVEIARDVAQEFNHEFGSEVLTLPAAKINPAVPALPGTDGRKMSKSYGNVIPIFATEKETEKLLKRIPTDSTPVEAPKDPDNDNLFALYRAFASAQQTEELAARYRSGGVGYGEVKGLIADLVNARLREPRERYHHLIHDRPHLEGVLHQGGEAARSVARTVLSDVRECIGVSRLT